MEFKPWFSSGDILTPMNWDRGLKKEMNKITEKITLHITQLWGCYDDEGEKIFRGTMMGIRELFFLKKESESDLTISVQLSDSQQTEKEKKKR